VCNADHLLIINTWNWKGDDYDYSIVFLAISGFNMSLLRTFGFGRLPPDAALLASRETFVFVFEHCWASITFRDFTHSSG